MAEWAPAHMAYPCPAPVTSHEGVRPCGEPGAYVPVTFGPVMCFEHAAWVRRRVDLQVRGSIATYRAWLGLCNVN